MLGAALWTYGNDCIGAGPRMRVVPWIGGDGQPSWPAGRFLRPSPSLLVTIKIKTYEKGSFKTVRAQRLWEATAELREQ